MQPSSAGESGQGRTLEALLDRFEAAGVELVEMVLADGDSWDRYAAGQWWPLDEWLRHGAEQFAADHELADALVKLATHDDSRKCLVLLGTIVDSPSLVDRLFEALKTT